MDVFLIVFVWFFLSWGVGAFANSRGRSGIGFGLLSFFTSPLLGVIVVLIIKDINAENERDYRSALEHDRHLESVKAIARSNANHQPRIKHDNPKKSFSVADELSKLGALKEKGLLTEEEFSAQKRQLLAKQ